MLGEGSFSYILLKLRQHFFIRRQQKKRKSHRPRRVLPAQPIGISLLFIARSLIFFL